MPRTRCPKTGRFNCFNVGDDGTMDTVVSCSQCGEELRYNWDGPEDTDDGIPEEVEAQHQYNQWLDWCCQDAAEQHEGDE